MKLTIHFLFLFFIACTAIVNDLIIYISGLPYNYSIIISFSISIFLFSFLIKKQKFIIEKKYEKIDIFIILYALIMFLVVGLGYPDCNYDVEAYHIYLQENPFIDKINFDFFPGRIYCIFLFALGDRMHYIFRFFLGYRAGTIFSFYTIIAFYYVIKSILKMLIGDSKKIGIWTYFIFLVHIVSQCFGFYTIDNLGLIFILQLTYIILDTKNFFENKSILYLSLLISGIAVGIKLSFLFYIVIIFFIALIKYKDSLKEIKIKDFFIGGFLFIIPFAVYLVDNYKQTGSILFPYYNSIFKSDYFGLFNWSDRRFFNRNLIQLVFWPTLALLKYLDYGHSNHIEIDKELIVWIAFLFTNIYIIWNFLRKKEKNNLWYIGCIALLGTILWIVFLQGYVRYGNYIWVLYMIVLISSVYSAFEKIKIGEKLEKYSVNWRFVKNIMYWIIIFSIGIGAIIYGITMDTSAYINIFKDKKSLANTIEIDGVWGSISDDYYIENSSDPVLVRNPNTPIYNLDFNSLSTSEITKQMFYDKIKNNNIYAIIESDPNNEILELLYRFTLQHMNYKIEKIERIYDSSDIAFIPYNKKWILVKVKYIGE